MRGGARKVVRYGRPAPDPHAHDVDASPRDTSGAWSWASLMRRVFDLDVLAGPRCGGPLRVIATVQDPAVVRAILAPRARPLPTPPAPPHLPSPPSRSSPRSTLSGPRAGAALTPDAAPPRLLLAHDLATDQNGAGSAGDHRAAACLHPRLPSRPAGRRRRREQAGARGGGRPAFGAGGNRRRWRLSVLCSGERRGSAGPVALHCRRARDRMMPGTAAVLPPIANPATVILSSILPNSTTNLGYGRDRVCHYPERRRGDGDRMLDHRCRGASRRPCSIRRRTADEHTKSVWAKK